jgi:hypothetical protein
MLQPRTLKTLAHSTFGNGPEHQEQEGGQKSLLTLKQAVQWNGGSAASCHRSCSIFEKPSGPLLGLIVMSH